MKIRAGFVANSSTSSYLLVGVSDDTLISAFAKAQKITFNGFDSYDYGEGDEELYEAEMSHGVYDCDGLTYAGSDGTPFVVGIDAESILEKVNIPKAKEMFREKAKTLGIDILLSDIELLYGKAGN
jgi:hypothetical protein